MESGITREQLRKDIASGIIVGIIALPLAIAFAIASGVSPEKGLVTAIIAGFAISVFGGSRVQIGGPTGAFIIIVADIVRVHGVGGLTIATFHGGYPHHDTWFCTGRWAVEILPHTLVVALHPHRRGDLLYTDHDFAGLGMMEVPAEMVTKWSSYVGHISMLNPYAVLLGITALLLTILLPKLIPRIPGPLAAIVVCTAAAWFMHWPVETIEGRFGAIPNTLPMPGIAPISMATLRELIKPAIAIALLGSIESLLSAVVSDGMIGAVTAATWNWWRRAVRTCSPLFWWHPSNRCNCAHGDQCEERRSYADSGIVHAITLLVIMLVAARWPVRSRWLVWRVFS